MISTLSGIALLRLFSHLKAQRALVNRICNTLLFLYYPDYIRPLFYLENSDSSTIVPMGDFWWDTYKESQSSAQVATW